MENSRSQEQSEFIKAAKSRGETPLVYEVEPGTRILVSGAPESVALLLEILADYEIARQICEGMGSLIARRMLKASADHAPLQ